MVPQYSSTGSVAKKAFGNRTRGVRRGWFNRSFWEWGSKGGFFNILVQYISKNFRKYLPSRIKAGHFVWEFPKRPSTQPCECLLLRSRERGLPVLVHLLLPLSFYLFPCFQLLSDVIFYCFIRRGSIITPRFEKEPPKSFDHFLIQPPLRYKLDNPSLQH